VCGNRPRALHAVEQGAHDGACALPHRSGKKKRLMNLQKGDKLHARMFKKKEQDKMQEEDEQ